MQRRIHFRAIIGLALLLATAATLITGAAFGTNGPRGDAARKKLTSSERRALRIVSVKESGADPAGVIVEVTFAGNIERALGRGHLKRAVVGVILHPSSSTVQPTKLATEGAGRIGHTISRGPTKDVGVLRRGRKLLFFVGGPGSGQVARVEVKAFAAALASHKIAKAAIDDDDRFWAWFGRQFSLYEESVNHVDDYATVPPCAGLERSLADIDYWLKRGQENKERLDFLREDIAKQLKHAQHESDLGARYSAAVYHTFLAPLALREALVTGRTPFQNLQSWRDAVRDLKIDAKYVETYSQRNQQTLDKLAAAKAKFEALAAVECARPFLRQIHAVFTQDTFSTVYTEDLLHQPTRGGTLTYEWAVTIHADPPCANGFQPATPAVNQATWTHKDTSQGGPCNHNGDAYPANGRGHPGVVKVIVRNDVWTCVAAYSGTQGDDGAPTGDGDYPTPCERR